MDLHGGKANGKEKRICKKKKCIDILRISAAFCDEVLEDLGLFYLDLHIFNRICTNSLISFVKRDKGMFLDFNLEVSYVLNVRKQIK